MSSNNFSGNYLVLRPEEVSYLNVFRILWNDDIEKKAFVDFPDGKKENLHRRVVRPIKESETFLSIIGHMDKRVDLDKNIKLDDSRYYSALSVMAAKIAYENKAFVENAVINHWKVNGTKILRFYVAPSYA
ncbi:unnamed protein product [Dovyalis caffra]|uniref:Uncharacterized protein n=1 Tax=Dovyalis caffra TaxID=77055 RepID=A0AAV1RNS0_9ROSI|nr:unnamed protein product [Dovyalis caffra]